MWKSVSFSEESFYIHTDTDEVIHLKDHQIKCLWVCVCMCVYSLVCTVNVFINIRVVCIHLGQLCVRLCVFISLCVCACVCMSAKCTVCVFISPAWGINYRVPSSTCVGTRARGCPHCLSLARSRPLRPAWTNRPTLSSPTWVGFNRLCTLCHFLFDL